MPVPPESIQVDRCYLTEGGSIRRATSTGSDRLVRYKERVGSGPWLCGGTKQRRRHVFAATVVREVPYDWAANDDQEQGVR